MTRICCFLTLVTTFKISNDGKTFENFWIEVKSEKLFIFNIMQEQPPSRMPGTNRRLGRQSGATCQLRQ